MVVACRGPRPPVGHPRLAAPDKMVGRVEVPGLGGQNLGPVHRHDQVSSVQGDLSLTVGLTEQGLEASVVKPGLDGCEEIGSLTPHGGDIDLVSSETGRASFGCGESKSNQEGVGVSHALL